MKKSFFLYMLIGMASTLCGQTIAEKKASLKRYESELDPCTLEQMAAVNHELEARRSLLSTLYEEAAQLHLSGSSQAIFEPLLAKIKSVKKEIAEIQEMWRAEGATLHQNDAYSLWHQPETTLHQLVLDYGAPDAIYFIPPEIGTINLSINSNIPIPRQSWGECLELILARYGFGIRVLNPFLKEIYILSTEPSAIQAILDDPSAVGLYPENARICFVLSPSTTDPRADLIFFQKFTNPLLTKVDIVNGKIFITAPAKTISELLKLYSFAHSKGGKQEFQLITLTKMPAKEMEMILASAFYDPAHFSQGALEGASLRIICMEHLPHSLFLSGSSEEIKKASSLIRDLEFQIEEPHEKTVFWYTPKHSDPEELATVLAQVYDLLTDAQSIKKAATRSERGSSHKRAQDKLAGKVVPATQVGPKASAKNSHRTSDGQNNFIVDPKTGAIIMVVEAEALAQIKELLKKLDVPKKMVQIEVLLFEKKISNNSRSGLNLLRLGQSATGLVQTGLNFATGGSGILEFLISRGKSSGIPAYDLAYQFMLGQEDVQINASPSVTTINQTPATIAIVDEVSIDSGADDKKQRVYTRAQYGITIQITPTINQDDAFEDSGFVTLETDITFDTPKKNSNDRPDVTRRHIKNHVRIADGQTVILGGLRRKNSHDQKESIPFLGEIPGIGKLFSQTDMQDDSTEMFIFITPKILSDPIKDAERIRKEEFKKRPGDHPEYLNILVSAQAREKKRLFETSLKQLLGRELSACISQDREYDGKSS